MDFTTFAALGCSEPFLDALNRRGFESPMPVQAACFTPGIEGRDLLVQSRTGSGKTLAFGLPLLHRLSPDQHPQGLVLTPTRELAQQVASELSSVHPKLRMAQLVGGVSYGPQFHALEKGAPIIVGTPGRIMDHLERGTLDLSKVSMVVLDECDEMLNMGFLEDVELILSKVPQNPQTYLFSATLPGPIASLAQKFLKNPHHVQLSEGGGTAQHADIAHTPCVVSNTYQSKALVNFLLHDEPASALIFTRTKLETEEVAEALTQAGLSAAFLHGDMAQAGRTRTLNQFKQGRTRYLVATDVAARGLDIESMPLVIHLGIPFSLEAYIHRSGRTGRAGAKGVSLALVNPKEARILMAWSRRANLSLEWRTVPKPAEIARLRGERLQESLKTLEASKYLDLAKRLVEEQDPVELVAALLSLAHPDREARGFDLPEERLVNKSLSRPFQDRMKNYQGSSWEDRPKSFQDKKPAFDKRKPGEASRPEGKASKSWEKPWDKPKKAWDRPFQKPNHPRKSGM